MNYPVGSTVFYSGMLRGEIDEGRVLWSDGKEILVEAFGMMKSRHFLRTDTHLLATTRLSFWKKFLQSHDREIAKTESDLKHLQVIRERLLEKIAHHEAD